MSLVACAKALLLHDYTLFFVFWFYHREKELAAVKINPVDVDIIANELEVRITFNLPLLELQYCGFFLFNLISLNMQLDKKVAERVLREHKGDAVAAIRSLIN